MPIEFSGYVTVRIGEPAQCDGSNNYAAITDCSAKKCTARLKPR